MYKYEMIPLEVFQWGYVENKALQNNQRDFHELRGTQQTWELDTLKKLRSG